MSAPFVPPRGFESWNRALQGAYRKGWAAFLEGKPQNECPYNDKRKDCGRLTWSRSFITAWQDGWSESQKQAAISDFYSGPDGNRAAKHYR